MHFWTVFKPFGFTLNEKQIPQIIEKNKNLGARWMCGKDFFCAQGRCATRLRYAPTKKYLFILKHLPTEHPSWNPLSSLISGRTVPKLYQNPIVLPSLYQNQRARPGLLSDP
jgi:hypothetical protein